jgi:hypothetical protein
MLKPKTIYVDSSTVTDLSPSLIPAMLTTPLLSPFLKSATGPIAGLDHWLGIHFRTCTWQDLNWAEISARRPHNLTGFSWDSSVSAPKFQDRASVHAITALFMLLTNSMELSPS